MANIRRVEDERAAVELADLLNGNERRRPVVVVTVPSGHDEPWIDVEEIAEQAGPLADVYLMPTGAFTWEFSRKMVDGTQVYGGAGRVYPVGHDWVRDLGRSPLRFAFDAAGGQRATQDLVSDVLRMAASSGLHRAVPVAQQRPAEGQVAGIMAGRAMVRSGRDLLSIAEELTAEGVPIDRLVVRGQSVSGTYDVSSKRLDVTASLRTAAEALADYAEGDVVLARVDMVRNGKAELTLYPATSTAAVTVAVLRADVTSNPLDDLRTLMTVGEVLHARVASTEPWALVLNDIDDDEVPVPAPSLLPDGPAWLWPGDTDPVPEEVPVPEAPSLPVVVAPAPIAEAPQAVIEPDAPPPPARPSPVMFDRNRSRPVERSSPPAPVAEPAGAPPAEPAAEQRSTTREWLLQIDALKAEVARLREQVAGVMAEKDEMRFHFESERSRANRAEHDLKSARSRLRRAKSGKSGADDDRRRPVFADREAGFRHLVTTQWATRTIPAEQATRPIPQYRIGPDFLDSLAALEGISDEKVADVVFEIVTDRAKDSNGRDVHRLRTGPGGDDPYVMRDDGAACWRACLQVNTPSARRIHYWVRADGEIELSRVAVHDEFEP